MIYNITLYATTSEITLQTDGLCLATEVIAGSLASMDLDCYYLNFEQPKISEVMESVGGILKDDDVYSKQFNIVTERWLIADFGAKENSLINVLKNTNKYIKVNTYSFVPFETSKMMPIAVMSKSVPESVGGYKWFELELQKNNKESI